MNPVMLIAACFVLEAPPRPDPPRPTPFDVREIVPMTESIGSALVSRDGTRVAFTRSIRGTTEIFLANTDGSGSTGITAFGDGRTLRLESISGDGSIVAFTREVAGIDQVFGATSTGVVRQLTSATAPSTQPRLNGAGDRIYFRRPGGVFVMNGLGADVRRLTQYPAQLGNTGVAGDRIGARYVGLRNRIPVDVLIQIEWTGAVRDLGLPPTSGPPLLSADEQTFATLESPTDVVAQGANSPYVNPLVWIDDFATGLAALSRDASFAIIEAGSRIELGYSYYSLSPLVLHDAGFRVGGVSASDSLDVIAFSQRSSGSLFGLRVIDRRPSPIRVEAPVRMVPGNWSSVTFVSTQDPGERFIAAASFGATTGTPLADGRVFPLDSDRLARYSVRPVNDVFIGFRGRLDATGRADGEIRLPADARLLGRTVYLAFVVWNASYPGGILRISPATDVYVNVYSCP